MCNQKNFDKEFIKSLSNGERLGEIKQLSPVEILKLGQLVKEYEQNTMK